MKKTLFSSVLVALLSVSSGFASHNSEPTPEPPEFIPFQSRGAMRSWIFEQVTQGSLHAYGATLLEHPDNETSFWESGETPGEVVKRLESQDFRFATANPNDYISIQASLSNQDGYEVLSGYASVLPILNDDGTGYKLPEDTVLSFDMPDTLIIRLPGIKNAKIVHRDENGVIQWFKYLDVHGDHFHFPMEYAGENDELILSFRLVDEDGNVRYEDRAYSLATGQQAELIIVSSGAPKFILENYLEKDDSFVPAGKPLLVYNEAFDEDGDGEIEPPVFRVRLGKERTVQVMSFVKDKIGDTEWYSLESPDEMWFRSVGGEFETELTEWSVPNGWFGRRYEIKLPPGDYMFVPEYSRFEEEPVSPWNNDGGGKGALAPTKD